LRAGRPAVNRAVALTLPLVGTSVLAAIVLKHKELNFASIGQIVRLGREWIRSLLAHMSDYFVASGYTTKSVRLNRGCS
jgi:hypothetical protein